MPKTAKARNKNVTAKSCDEPKYTARKPKSKERNIKGLVAESPKGTVVEEVFHRKSERRRVARDIFLVFEEESNCRRKTRSNKKQTKPKFGHLKVEDPNAPKGLLRDIKNEAKCYTSSSIAGATAIMPAEAVVKTRSINLNSLKKEDKSVKSREKKVSNPTKLTSDCTKKSKNIKSLQIALGAEPCTYDTEQNFVARVNPIFLWVKQDNTRIVEVRCEDYDKRNRIRITKTSNGWRSIPRSDPTTSRVLKFYPTPLMKVKREGIHEVDTIISNNKEKKEIMVSNCFSLPGMFPVCVSDEVGNKLIRNDTVCNPLFIKNIKKSRRKPKKLKKKQNSEKILKASPTATIETIVNNETLPKLLHPPFKTNSSEIPDSPVQNSSTLESIINKEISPENRKDLDDNIPEHNFEINTDMKDNTNSSVTYNNLSETKSPYRNETEKEFFHLCPKTGLFLPNYISVAEYENESVEKVDEQNTLRTVKNSFLLSSKNEYNTGIEKINIDSKIQVADENTESLDAKTKNLKDLLDDADLLQNCDENSSNDADLIDTLVKTSCENNLIQANEIISKANIDQLNQKSLHRSNEMVVHLLADVSDPPKCLSFNEAGEIEGLNGELFQSNTYVEHFDKQASVLQTEPQIMLHSTSNYATSAMETTVASENSTSSEHIENIVRNADINNSNLIPLNETEDSPKDLSYKKREEVCPPSESRSQCAVTSSSDVVKSPTREEASPLASSETLKNLILEQFLKLNVLTTQHQSEPIDFEKQKQSDKSNSGSLLYNSKTAQFSNIFETVVIEDDESGCDIEHEEPLKKRSRLNKHKIVTQNMGKMSMINEDPDPLTQLRLLIRNTQWKVPDPILVPKDRLSAVLASPAREIPLLITTRPELRLPEAFAYPEIIQNPNILVISMAQLEAILKNELEMEKRESSKTMNTEMNQELSSKQIDVQLNHIKDLELPSPTKHLSNATKDPKNILSCASNIRQANNKTPGHKDISTCSLSAKRHEYAKNSQTTSSLSDINSATMAVLNQMLWLPYFGKLSKTLQEKYSNLDPYANSKLNGITNLEEILKNIPNRKMDEKSVSNTRFQTFQQQFTPNEELSLFQQIVQHQMQSVLELNQLKADSLQVTDAASDDSTVFSIDKSKSKVESLSNSVEQRKQKVYPNKQTTTSMCKNQTNNSNNILVQEKSYNLRSSVASRHPVEPKQYSDYNQRQVTDNKPRLTCKSLSNLLDPEHTMLPSPSSSTPLAQNLSTDYLKNVNEIKRGSSDCKVNSINAEGKRQYSCNTTVPQLHASYSNMNISFDSSSEVNTLKPKAHENYHSNTDAPALATETNVPLWHPLFGSNTKTAYSSPWQWTTVTATGE